MRRSHGKAVLGRGVTRRKRLCFIRATARV
jgi:hypothetical protein